MTIQGRAIEWKLNLNHMVPHHDLKGGFIKEKKLSAEKSRVPN